MNPSPFAIPISRFRGAVMGFVEGLDDEIRDLFEGDEIPADLGQITSDDALALWRTVARRLPDLRKLTQEALQHNVVILHLKPRPFIDVLFPGEPDWHTRTALWREDENCRVTDEVKTGDPMGKVVALLEETLVHCHVDLATATFRVPLGDEIHIPLADIDALRLWARQQDGEVPLLPDALPTLPNAPAGDMSSLGQEHGSGVMAVIKEMARAREKHPGNAQLFTAMGEEVGELADAILAGDFPHAKEEAVQVACVALRIVEECDGDWMSKPTGHRLSLLDAASSFGDGCRAVLEGEVADGPRV